MRIGILGAPGSGKSRLAAELQQQLHELHLDFSVVLDNPQDWCRRHQDGAIGPVTESITLLCGLDLPSPSNESTQQQAMDSQLRELLNNQSMTFHVVYGLGPQRSANALKIIQHRLKLPPADAAAKTDWVWVCDKCSDSACEHKLFTDKLAIPGPQPFY
ncbi:MAG: hypothetical protein WBI20_04680 [Burkholderiaceae bacterium]